MNYYIVYYSAELLLLWIICIIFFIYLIEKIIYKKDLNKNYLSFVSFLLIFVLYNILFLNLNVNEPLYLLDNYFVYVNCIQNIKSFILFLSLIFFIFLYNFLNIVKLPIFEYIILILIIILSLFLMLSTNHLFYLFLFLEMVNLSLYVLIGLNKNSNFGIEIAYKYFIQSSYVTIVGLFGISLIYFRGGTLFISELHFLMTSYPSDNLLYFAFFLIFITFFFKLGLFPLHNWVADLYQNAHLSTVVFISVVPKLPYVYVILELYYVVNISRFIFFFLILIGFLSVVYGSIFALYEASIRRLLGYGSIVHMGFVILGISTFELQGVGSAFFYLISYTLLVLNFFLVLLLFIDRKSDNDEVFIIDNITSMNIILNKNTLLSVIFSFIILSLAGLPFFVGFFSKLYVLLSLISYGYLFLVFILLFINILSTLYYIRLIRFILFIEEKTNKIVQRPTGVVYSSLLYNAIVFLFILNILILFFHNYVLLFILNNIIIFF